MHGTRQQLVIAPAVVATGLSAPALAYHNGQLFDRAPGGGGAGGLFYTGSKRDRGWDCTACHVDPAREVKINVTSQPPGLLDDRAYIPGQAYVISVAFADPAKQLGVAATRSNFNSMAVSFLDPDSVPVGTISGFDPTKFYARGNAILASDTTS